MSTTEQQSAPVITKDAATSQPAVDEAIQHSIPGQLADLPIGGTVTITRRLDLDKTDRTMIAETTKALRNTLSAAVARASKRTGKNYVTETGKGFTRTDDILVHASATRIS